MLKALSQVIKFNVSTQRTSCQNFFPAHHACVNVFGDDGLVQEFFSYAYALAGYIFSKSHPPPTPRSDPNSTRAVTDHHELPWAVHVRESKWRVCARESKWRLVQRKELSIVLFTDLPRVLHTQYSACCTQTLVPTLSSHGKLIVFVPRKYKRIGAPGLGASLPRALISKESA